MENVCRLGEGQSAACETYECLKLQQTFGVAIRDVNAHIVDVQADCQSCQAVL